MYKRQTSYPFDVEEKLLAAVAKGERDTVENYLNELFGYIFFASGHVFSVAKSRVAELLVLISRTAVHNGADPEKCLMLTHDYLLTLPNIQTWEILDVYKRQAMGLSMLIRTCGIMRLWIMS